MSPRFTGWGSGWMLLGHKLTQVEGLRILRPHPPPHPHPRLLSSGVIQSYGISPSISAIMETILYPLGEFFLAADDIGYL